MRNLLLFGMIATVTIVSLVVGNSRYDDAALAAMERANMSAQEARDVGDADSVAATSPRRASAQRQVADTSQVSSSQTSQTAQTAQTTAPTAAAALQNVPHIGSVQVLNGCGTDGAGARMAEILRSHNFDVKDIGNAPTFNYPSTMIISRTADMTLANEIEKILKTGRVTLIRNGDELYDVAVITGAAGF